MPSRVSGFSRPVPAAVGLLLNVSYAAGEYSSTVREAVPFYFNHVGHAALGYLAGGLAGFVFARQKAKHNQDVSPVQVHKAAIIGGTIIGAAVMGASEVPFIADSIRNLMSTVEIPLPGNRAMVPSSHPPTGGDVIDVAAGAAGALLGASAIRLTDHEHTSNG